MHRTEMRGIGIMQDARQDVRNHHRAERSIRLPKILRHSRVTLVA